MEVALPSSPPMDLASSPINYLSAPSSPRRSSGPCFLSAPASPTRISEFYRQYEDFSIAMEMSHMSQTRPSCSVSSVPFSWEEKPGTPKKKTHEFDDFDFAFDVKVESDMGSAEELFSGGKIRPLKQPPRLQLPESDNQRTPLIPSPTSSASPIAKGRKLLMEAFSPRKKQSDPFRVSEKQSDPFRVSEEQGKKQSARQQEKPSLTSSSSSSASTSRRWRFKDFLLFRSASEGRGSDKDPLRKYVKRQEAEVVKNGGSFRSEARNGGSFRSEAAGSGSRRRVSAHEMHYAANRAASEDMKKRTFLPYKQGILGRLAFNPAVHALANGFGSLVVKNER